MADQTPQEVVGPWVSTGMAHGLHTWLATALAVSAIALGLFAGAITTPVIALLFMSAAVGLLGELRHIFRTGEVRARRSESSRVLIISRKSSPARFYFYFLTYLVLGGFSLLITCLALAQLLSQHA